MLPSWDLRTLWEEKMSEVEGKPDRLRVAGLGDLHIHQTNSVNLQGIFDKISQHADVLALCGDLTHLGLPQEAERLVAELRSCRVPVVAVLGNHDYQSGHADEVKKILREGKVVVLDETETFEFKGVGFAGAKGFGGGFDKHMLTPFGEDPIKHFVNEAVNESLRLEVALNSLRTEKTVVVLHYAPIAATVAGEPPEIFPFLGSSRLAETIDHFDVDVVFHGHAHHGTFQGRTTKGIPVYNCCLQLVERISPEQPYALVEV
jgi:Icc-related predicted phosphoesterase